VTILQRLVVLQCLKQRIKAKQIQQKERERGRGEKERDPTEMGRETQGNRLLGISSIGRQIVFLVSFPFLSFIFLGSFFGC